MSEQRDMNCSEFRRLCGGSPQRRGNGNAESDSQWELHLLGCTDCAAFYAELQSQALPQADSEKLQARIMEQTLARREQIDDQLAALCSMEPPPELLASVLAETTRKRRVREVAEATPWWAPIEQLFLRPRIAIEASFVLTLAWVLTFGMPTELLVGVASAEQQMQQPLVNSRRQLIELQEDVAGFVKETLLRDLQGEQP